jgi:RNA polymerase sigma factor (sigma-70 family)
MFQRRTVYTCVACHEESSIPFDRWSDLFCLFLVTGDNRFFADILDGTHDVIESHAVSVCRFLGLAEEFVPVLLNDASLKLLNAAPGFDCRKPLVPYHKSIVTNCGRDRARYEFLRRAESLSSRRRDDDEGSVACALEPAAPAISDPAVQAESNEAVQKIHQAVFRLPEPDRRIMAAKIAGSHRREIAEKFGYTPEKVSRILHRARQRLRDELD